MAAAIEQAKTDGGRVLVGGERVTVEGAAGGSYVAPAVVSMPAPTHVVRTETFAPILYTLGYSDVA